MYIYTIAALFNHHNDHNKFGHLNTSTQAFFQSLSIKINKFVYSLILSIMKGLCSVPDCQNDISKVHSHSFPKDKNLLKLWLKAIRRENWTPGKWSKICSKHFFKRDFMQYNKHGECKYFFIFSLCFVLTNEERLSILLYSILCNYISFCRGIYKKCKFLF